MNEGPPSPLPLLDLFHAYERKWPACSPLWNAEREAAVVERFVSFVRRTPDCLERTSPRGHFTASALVVDPTLERVLLTRHRKLGLWIQLGGHADGHLPLHEVSLREATEESGLDGLVLFDVASTVGASPEPPLPLDIDVHSVPARPGEPHHLHFDVRYLVVAPCQGPLVRTQESDELAWLTLAEARQCTSERSMHRQFDKLEWIRENGTGRGEGEPST